MAFYSVRNSKAIIAAMMFEILSFAVFYILDEIKELAPAYVFVDSDRENADKKEAAEKEKIAAAKKAE